MILAVCISLLALTLPGVEPATAADEPAAKLDLYLLVGQSNMAGRGKVEKEDATAHPRVFALNKDDQWVPAVDPLHFDKRNAGVGLGLAFGKALADENKAVAIGLIPCAAGGSPISVWKKDALSNWPRSTGRTAYPPTCCGSCIAKIKMPCRGA